MYLYVLNIWSRSNKKIYIDYLPLLDVSDGLMNVFRLRLPGAGRFSRSMLSSDSFDSYRWALVGSTMLAVLLLTGVSTFRLLALLLLTWPARIWLVRWDKSLVLTDLIGLGVMFCSCCFICSCWSFMMLTGLAEGAFEGRLALTSSFSDETGSTRFFQSSSPHRFNAASLTRNKIFEICIIRLK